jgi:Calcineurin-like phosphoesterase
MPNGLYLSAGCAVAGATVAVAVAYFSSIACLPDFSSCLYPWAGLLGADTLTTAQHLREALDGQPAPKPTERGRSCVLALADLHGDIEQTERALRLIGAVDANGQWSASGCTLVQTGDLVDRGPDSMSVVRRFERLKVEAAADEPPGQVITLLGNHELMQLQVCPRPTGISFCIVLGNHVVCMLPDGNVCLGAQDWSPCCWVGCCSRSWQTLMPID